MPNPSVPFSIRHTAKHLHKTVSARSGRAAGARVLLKREERLHVQPSF